MQEPTPEKAQPVEQQFSDPAPVTGFLRPPVAKAKERSQEGRLGPEWSVGAEPLVLLLGCSAATEPVEEGAGAAQGEGPGLSGPTVAERRVCACVRLCVSVGVSMCLCGSTVHQYGCMYLSACLHICACVGNPINANSGVAFHNFFLPTSCVCMCVYPCMYVCWGGRVGCGGQVGGRKA